MIVTGDCLEEMRKMDGESVTAIVTDPPYALEFMGKGWDKVLPTEEIWREALRIVKPGGFLLSFGGTRTYHRLTCSIEDAGWQIRDCLMWMYGSGFPKSLDISKAIDKAAGAEREVVGKNPHARPIDGDGGGYSGPTGHDPFITVPATDSARHWSGYGTALKPAWEPIVVAMKPCGGTFASNALTHGVAGINVDGCRVETNDNLNGGSYDNTTRDDDQFFTGKKPGGAGKFNQPSGRFPANLILDEEAGAMLDEQSGVTKSSVRVSEDKDEPGSTYSLGRKGTTPRGHSDSGGASRFFYCAKAPKNERLFYCRLCQGVFEAKERDAHKHDLKKQDHIVGHPTQKPVALMRYLARLLTMPSGTVILDPFMGSGSTGVACREEGVDFIGVEMDLEYMEIAKRRIEG